jgi:hypothetical protein
MNMHARVVGFIAAVVLGIGCGSGKPEISNTKVEPSTWAVSGLSDTVTFKVTTDVMNLGGKVNKVHAQVDGKDIGFDLAKKEDLSVGERWEINSKLTLWNGISEGTYKIDITATDDKGTTVTEKAAATVTVTN